MTEVPQEWVEAFGEGWHSVPEGKPGDRRRAGLLAVEPLIREDERERMRHWSNRCLDCGKTHYYEDYDGERRAHQRTTGMAPAMGYQCVCGRWAPGTSEWHDHLTGKDDVEPGVPDPTVGTNSARFHADCMPGDCLVARTLKNPDIPCPVNPPEVTPDMAATRLFWIWLDGRWATQGGVARNFMERMDEG